MPCGLQWYFPPKSSVHLVNDVDIVPALAPNDAGGDYPEKE